MSWRIRTHPRIPGKVTYQRHWDPATQVTEASLRPLLYDLERLEKDYPGWYVGFRLPSPALPDKVDEVWAQYPGETVVHAPTAGELRAKIREARTALNL